MYYSKQAGGFYSREIHGDNIPPDAVEITPEQHTVLLQGQSEGRKITGDENGYPVLINPVPPSIDDLKAAKFNAINADFAAAASALTEGYPEAERLTWPVQQQEAMAWAADSNAPTPYLDGLAAARGVTPEEMREKTLEQTQLFMATSQQLVGTRQRLRDLVHDAQTPEALDDINWPA